MSDDTLDCLLHEFSSLENQYPNPQVLLAAVLHIGLGRIARSIEEYTDVTQRPPDHDDVDLIHDALHGIKETVSEVVHALNKKT